MPIENNRSLWTQTDDVPEELFVKDVNGDIYTDENGNLVIGTLSPQMRKILDDINLDLTPINTPKQ